MSWSLVDHGDRAFFFCPGICFVRMIDKLLDKLFIVIVINCSFILKGVEPFGRFTQGSVVKSCLPSSLLNYQ